LSRDRRTSADDLTCPNPDWVVLAPSPRLTLLISETYW
jgi:hypothetical protein